MRVYFEKNETTRLSKAEYMASLQYAAAVACAILVVVAGYLS